MDSKIYEVLPNNPEQRRFLELLAEETEINAWDNSFKPKTVNFSVPAYIQKDFEKLLTEQNLDFKLIIHDGQSEYNLGVQPQAAPSVPNGQISFDKYYRYSEIQDYLKHLSKTHPKYVHFENYGLSYEKRNLSFVRISSGGSHHKPIIFIDAGIHAREWIAPAMALYIIHQLVENSENRYLINNVDWIIIPLANPDGYEYSHVKDRSWRKTRSSYEWCNGVDANRNFNFHWNGIGSSQSRHSIFFAGKYPFSEPESAAIGCFILKHSKEIKLYVTLHCAATCIAYPYGIPKLVPNNIEELHHLAGKVQRAMKRVNHRKYRIGNIHTLLEPSSGSSCDWVYTVPKIRLSYVMELRGGGKKGYDLPESEIFNVVQEGFQGFKEFHGHIETKYKFCNVCNDRFWRKNRSRNRPYHGVDLNRNFDVKWNTEGSSTNKSSELYSGRRSFSEPETRALAKIIYKHCRRIKLYLTLHSAAKSILYPFGFTLDPPRNIAQLFELGKRVRKAVVDVYGTNYAVSSIAERLNPMSGTSTDWVYLATDVELCYMIELPGGGKRGFDLPEDQILKVVTEVFGGIKVFHDYINGRIEENFD